MVRRIAGAAAVVGMLVAGCSAVGDAGPSVSPSVATIETASSEPPVSMSPSASPSPTPSPSPSPSAWESFPPAPATESPEQAEIRAAWLKYCDVRARFAADPSQSDWSETQRVTTGEEANSILTELGALRNDGLRSLGGLRFRDIVVGEPTQRPDGVTEAVITYCVDRTDVKLVDTKTGEPLAVEEPFTLVETATLELGLDHVWRVALTRNQVKPC